MSHYQRVLLFCCALTFSGASMAQSLPDGAIQGGSLANQQLIRDAMLGVAAKVTTLGCDEPEQFFPYVLEMPSGAVGARVWRELWIVEGCANEYPIKIRFNEDGPEAATWMIE